MQQAVRTKLALRKAIDCLRAGDVAMLCGYSAWRPQMEKSFVPDTPGLRRITGYIQQVDRRPKAFFISAQGETLG
jgi:hypothetical protein